VSGGRRLPRVGTRAWIGTSGYDYPAWKGPFYPPDLPRSRWLAHASRAFDSIEINGTFYSLKSPDTFRRWVAASPPGFVFAIKGSRYITHNLKLLDAEGALANFFASGVLGLGARTGPFLWQLAQGHAFSPERLDAFLRLLPRSSAQAASLAAGHDGRLRQGSLTEAAVDVPYRHALEVRHPSWFQDEAYALLAAHDAALVVSDAPGWPRVERLAGSFAYARLHGSRELYASDYTDEEIDGWARRVREWKRERDVYVYFDNDARAHAPTDAVRLRQRVDALTRRRPLPVDA
jgi:uncharacterized protein YecE (DUF72 family)